MDRQRTLLPLLLLEVGLFSCGKPKICHHSAIYLIQRSGIELGYSFLWRNSTVWCPQLEDELTFLFESTEDPSRYYYLSSRMRIKLGILNNRYRFSSCEESELNAFAAYRFQQISFSTTPQKSVQLRGTKVLSLPEFVS